MKKFRWRLQRVLDLKSRQEEVLRADLITLMEKTAALRGRIMMLQAMLRNAMAEIRELAGMERIATQSQFLEFAPVRDRQIALLRQQLQELEMQRKKKMNELAEMRKFRKSLEQLRLQAAEEYSRQLNLEEQKLLDERSHQAFQRNELKFK